MNLQNVFGANATHGDVKKYLNHPYKKVNHFQEQIDRTREENSYADSVVDLLKSRLLNETNSERYEFFIKLIEKINYIDSIAFKTLSSIINKVLRRTKLYNYKYEIVNLIERFIGKKITFSPEFIKSQLKYSTSFNIKPRGELSPCGKYMQTYFTTKDLDGKVVSTYYMSEFGRKNGLSDQYKIHKLKEIIEKEKPKFDNCIPIIDTLNMLCNPNPNQKKSLKENDDLWKEIEKDPFFNTQSTETDDKISEKIAKDLGWL